MEEKGEEDRYDQGNDQCALYNCMKSLNETLQYTEGIFPN